jgi:hypothetical protein
MVTLELTDEEALDLYWLVTDMKLLEQMSAKYMESFTSIAKKLDEVEMKKGN